MAEKRIPAGKADGRGRTELRLDYTTYRFSKKEIAQYVAMYLMLDVAISYLFFYSPIAFFVLLPGMWPFLKEQKASLKRKRESEMRRQFLDGIQMTSASLQAGYSVENAFREAAGELTRIYKEDDFILREFRILAAQMDMSRNIEDLLMDLGRRSGVEDIISFAEVFLTAKRSGGDLLLIIRNTASCIRQKHETMQEIETCLSGKVMEQNIMSLVPVLILAYVKISSPEFLDGMYGNLTGTAVMTVCFAVYTQKIRSKVRGWDTKKISLTGQVQKSGKLRDMQPHQNTEKLRYTKNRRLSIRREEMIGIFQKEISFRIGKEIREKTAAKRLKKKVQ